MSRVAISFRFLAGRYHATPWGRHVNEADIPWPPEPWRILRALVAVWHAKADRERFSEESLGRLVEALAGELPSYRLPRAVHSHTRHYMPVLSGRSQKRLLIFDAFLRLPADEPVLAVWPESLSLDAAERELLEHLLARLTYLGRAESWVEARRVEVAAGESLDCVPCEDASADRAERAAERVEDGEEVEILAPQPPSEYRALRESILAEDQALAGLTPARRRRVEATLPERYLDSLRLDTADVQRAGWSSHPGTRSVRYLRPRGALEPARRPSSPTRRPFTTARFALVGKPQPRVEDTVRVAERLRRALMSRAKHHAGPDDIPAALSGRGAETDDHRHAFFLPEDATADDTAGGDGHVDHLLVHAPGGLEDCLEALATLREIRDRRNREPTWRVLLEGTGQIDDFASASNLVGPAEVWESVTPYLHPWYAKKGLQAADQLVKEIGLRDLPELAAPPEAIPHLVIRGRRRRPVHFRRFRHSSKRLRQPDRRGGFWRLRFSRPVLGPLAFGFACHYGLGLFRPAPE